MLWTTCQNFT